MRIQSCENPQRIYNSYLKEYMFVSCGHCKTCKLRKSRNWVNRLEMETKCHKYCVFFTLTYSEDCVPQLVFDPVSFSLLPQSNTSIAIDCGGEDLTDCKDLLFVRPLKVLDVRQVQLFVKRFRRNLDNLYKNGTIKERNYPDVRYYINGEYGPTTYRPHHHGLMWFDSEYVKEHFDELLSKAWSKRDRVNRVRQRIGNVDWSFVQTSAAQYVATYVNSFDNLPKVFTYAKIRPFAVQSRHPALGSLLPSTEQIRKVFDNSLVEIGIRNEDGEVVPTPLLPSLENRLFPKCARYSSLSHSFRVAIYTISTRLPCREEFSCQEDFVKKIMELVQESWFDFLRPWLDDITDSYQDFKLLVKQVILSRRVVSQASIFCVSMDYYVSRIEDYYANKDSRNLLNQLVFEEDYSKHRDHRELINLDLDFVQNLYFSNSTINLLIKDAYGLQSFTPVDYSTFPDFKTMVSKSASVYKRTTKTKKKNDYLLAHPELAMFKDF